MTCETCKSWKPVKHYGRCDNPKLNNEGEPPVDGLAEADTLGVFPLIYTGPHFGCVQWSAKKERT